MARPTTVNGVAANPAGVAVRGDWDAAARYGPNDLVAAGGRRYLATAPGVNHEPPDADYWLPWEQDFPAVGRNAAVYPDLVPNDPSADHANATALQAAVDNTTNPSHPDYGAAVQLPSGKISVYGEINCTRRLTHLRGTGDTEILSSIDPSASVLNFQADVGYADATHPVDSTHVTVTTPAKYVVGDNILVYQYSPSGTTRNLNSVIRKITAKGGSTLTLDAAVTWAGIGLDTSGSHDGAGKWLPGSSRVASYSDHVITFSSVADAARYAVNRWYFLTDGVAVNELWGHHVLVIDRDLTAGTVTTAQRWPLRDFDFSGHRVALVGGDTAAPFFPEQVTVEGVRAIIISKFSVGMRVINCDYPYPTFQPAISFLNCYRPFVDGGVWNSFDHGMNHWLEMHNCTWDYLSLTEFDYDALFTNGHHNGDLGIQIYSRGITFADCRIDARYGGAPGTSSDITFDLCVISDNSIEFDGARTKFHGGEVNSTVILDGSSSGHEVIGVGGSGTVQSNTGVGYFDDRGGQSSCTLTGATASLWSRPAVAGALTDDVTVGGDTILNIVGGQITAVETYDSGLVADFDASGVNYQQVARSTLVAADADPVGSITDAKSGNHATATSAAIPTYKTGVFKGGALPAIRYNGTTNASVLGSDPTPSGPFMVAAVIIPRGTAAAYDPVYSSSHVARIFAKLTGGKWGFYTTGDVPAGTTLVAGTPYVLVMTYNGIPGASAAGKLYLNGAVELTYGGVGTPSGNPHGSTWIGAEPPDGRFFEFDLGQLRVYNALPSDAKVALVIDRLTDKWVSAAPPSFDDAAACLQLAGKTV